MQRKVPATHGVSASKFVISHHHLLRYDCGEIVPTNGEYKDPYELFILTFCRRSNQPEETRCSLFITPLMDNVGSDS